MEWDRLGIVSRLDDHQNTNCDFGNMTVFEQIYYLQVMTSAVVVLLIAYRLLNVFNPRGSRTITFQAQGADENSDGVGRHIRIVRHTEKSEDSYEVAADPDRVNRILNEAGVLGEDDPFKHIPFEETTPDATEPPNLLENSKADAVADAHLEWRMSEARRIRAASMATPSEHGLEDKATGEVERATSVRLRIRVLERHEFNVWVEGRLALEIRGDIEKRTFIPQGEVTIEIRPVEADVAYHVARIDTGTADEIQIGVRVDGALTFYNHDGSWAVLREQVHNPRIAGAPARSQPTSPRRSIDLFIRSLDGEWADVLVNDEVIAEIRVKKEITVQIPAGMHQFSVRAYMSTPYAFMEIDTRDARRIEMLLNEGFPPLVEGAECRCLHT